MDSVSGRGTRWVAFERQLSCDLAGEAVILNLDDGMYYGLNAVGTRVWQLVQSPRSEAELVDILLRELQVDRERLARDVDDLMRTLASHGLVHPVAP